MNSNQELVRLLEIVLVLIVHDSVQAKSYVLDSLAILWTRDAHSFPQLSVPFGVFPFSVGVSLM